MKDFTHALEQSLTGAIAARERARARRRRRVAFAVPAFACAAAVAFAALPAADRPSSAPEILRAASAAASEQEGLTGFGGFRYVRQSYRLDRQVLRHVCRTCDPEVIGRVQLEQTREAWVGADWQARAKTVKTTVTRRTTVRFIEFGSPFAGAEVTGRAESIVKHRPAQNWRLTFSRACRKSSRTQKHSSTWELTAFSA